MPALSISADRKNGFPRWLILLTVVFGTLLLTVWLWSRVCYFPWVVWNDLRLAPTIAFAQGVPVYSTAAAGTINTWLYGPLPLFFYWPASWSATADGALMIAAFMNLSLTVVPIALVCFTWPAADHENPSTRLGRAIACVLCLALWAERHYAVIFADNLAIACGLFANLILVRTRTSRGLWVAAILAVAALACKQTSVETALGQVLWLGITSGRRAALVHALRCGAAGATLGILGVVLFKWEGLWFTLIQLPATFGWDRSPWEKLRSVTPELAWQIILPGLIMIFARRAFRKPAALLPALTWAAALPLGLSAVFTMGGWLNSLHSLPLWLPPVLTLLFTAELPARRREFLQFIASASTAAIVCGRVILAEQLPLRPDTGGYHEAAKLAAMFPRRIWFPFHPLVTLYSDRRYYHDEDGLWVRVETHRGVSHDQLVAHLPREMGWIAFNAHWNDRGIARALLPPNAPPLVYGRWHVFSRTEINPTGEGSKPR